MPNTNVFAIGIALVEGLAIWLFAFLAAGTAITKAIGFW
jgi:hypothetical protein